jgi:hypothetical protein
LEITLNAGDWDAPPPECPTCNSSRVVQEFKAPGIIGSARSRAVATAERIAEEDYGVANMHVEGYEGVRNKVRYKDQHPASKVPAWNGNREALEAAIAIGRSNRRQGPDGLDVLQSALKDGSQPDLIEASKRRSARIW